MKYILTVCMLAFLSCNNVNKSDFVELKKNPVVTVINIDGCEYLQVWVEKYNPSKYGGGWYIKYALTHKGDCSNPIHNFK